MPRYVRHYPRALGCTDLPLRAVQERLVPRSPRHIFNVALAGLLEFQRRFHPRILFQAALLQPIIIMGMIRA